MKNEQMMKWRMTSAINSLSPTLDANCPLLNMLFRAGQGTRSYPSMLFRAGRAQLSCIYTLQGRAGGGHSYPSMLFRAGRAQLS